MRGINGIARRYLVALLAAFAALAARQLLHPLLGEYTPYLTMWWAVAFSAWYCG